MRVWRLFYWVRLLVIAFALFIGATAAFDVSLAPESDAASELNAKGRDAAADRLPEFETVVHESATDEVGGWLSLKIDHGLGRVEDLRLRVRELGSRVGDAVGQ